MLVYSVPGGHYDLPGDFVDSTAFSFSAHLKDLSYKVMYKLPVETIVPPRGNI